MMMRPTLLTLLMLITSIGQADIYVVTHRDNPLDQIEAQQVRDLYLARTRALTDDTPVKVFDRNESDLRTRFIRQLLGMSERQFEAYWARLVFAGRVLPLDIAVADDELISQIYEQKTAIGYLEEAPQSETLKTLLIIQE